MGKTPKKAAPGGDERNLYNRRPLKATTAASKASETNLHKRQRESESSNRGKLSGIQKKIPPGRRKKFQGQVRVATKLDLNRIAKPVGRPPGNSKEMKLVVPEKPEASNPASMQPESVESEVTAEVTVQNEDAQKDAPKEKQESVKECVDQAPPEPAPKEQENGTSKETVEEDGQEAPSDTIETKQTDEHEENDITLSYETEDSPTKAQEMKPTINESNDESKEDLPLAEAKSDVIEKEDLQSESQTDTESFSVEVLESTTSEVSEVSEIVLQNDAEKEVETGKEKPGEKEKEKPGEKEKEKHREKEKVKPGEKEKEKPEEKEKEKPGEVANETNVSFVSYDPAIMLKDVQIKLNDCMKENSKLFETSSAELDTLKQPPRDSMSFGKTLRSMSGRRSLSRMRHVTLREHRYSPNNSMFVNTSMASLPSDETEDFKILRYSIGLSDPMSATNGSQTDRKRKHDAEEWSSSIKKQKTESENSLLNTSISLLKGLRRPIQVSTPVSEMKFQSDKLDLTDEESNKSTTENAKKWCIIM